METITVRNGYDKRKNAEQITVRPMTFEEASALSYGSHVSFVGREGTLRTVKVNGQPKRWKRDASRIEIPVKYGLYEYTTFYNRHDGKIGNDCAYLVVAV